MLTQFSEVQSKRPYSFYYENLDAALEFEPSDPLVMTLRVLSSPKDGWVVSLELLQSGLRLHSGTGDLRIYPQWRNGRRTVNFVFGSKMHLTLRRKDVKKFLKKVKPYQVATTKTVQESLERELLVMLYSGWEDSKGHER